MSPFPASKIKPYDASASLSPSHAPSHTPKAPMRKYGVLAVTLVAMTFGFGSVSTGLLPGAFGVGQAHARALPGDQAPESFADLAAKVSPAVVNISTTATLSRKSSSPHGRFPHGPSFPEGSPFQDFFERFMGIPEGHPGQRRQQKTSSLGSGFLIDPAGYIVTNNHVIEAAAKNEGAVTATLADGRRFDAQIIGRDAKTDLALLKIEAEDALPSVSWGASEAARVGDWVIAVGNPFGLGGSVSAGIISARGRNIESGPYDDFLQIDAAINRGNSGGPSFNMQGDVIGVNTAIYSPNGGSIGIGFAIPSQIARNVIAELKEDGHVDRAWLGVSIQHVTEEIAESLDMTRPQGALVTGFEKSGPAGKAGMKPGDVILTFNGQDVAKMRDLPPLVAGSKIGASVPVIVWREGKRQRLMVKLAAMEDPETKVSAQQTPPQDEEG